VLQFHDRDRVVLTGFDERFFARRGHQNRQLGVETPYQRVEQPFLDGSLRKFLPNEGHDIHGDAERLSDVGLELFERVPNRRQ